MKFRNDTAIFDNYELEQVQTKVVKT